MKGRERKRGKGKVRHSERKKGKGERLEKWHGAKEGGIKRRKEREESQEEREMESIYRKGR